MDVYDQAGYGKEYRQYLANRKKYQKKNGSKLTRNPATVEYTRYITTYIRKQDPNLIYRIVGAVEYRNALDCFDWYCSEEEMQAFDELVQERDELEVEVNLSRNIVHPPSSLDQQAAEPDDKFRRRGLRWIMAIARTELGAMRIGFAADENAFQQLAIKYDQREYLKTVFDGMRSHFWTLADDPQLNGVLRGDANVTKTLAYFRRVLVATGFVDGGAALANDILTADQQKEMLDWKRKLNQIQSVLAARIKSFHKKTVVTGRR